MALYGRNFRGACYFFVFSGTDTVGLALYIHATLQTAAGFCRYLSIYVAVAVGLAMLTFRAITQLNELPISYHYIRNVKA